MADSISTQLKEEITRKLTAQLLRWNQGGKHSISEKAISIVVGRKDYEDVFSWAEDDQAPPGFVVAVTHAANTPLGHAPDPAISDADRTAVDALKELLADAVAEARKKNSGALKTLRGPADGKNPGSVFYAATAEDFVNGMNAVLDSDLQINAELARGR